MNTRCELCEQQGRRQRMAVESVAVVGLVTARVLVCLNDGNRFLEISRGGVYVTSRTEDDNVEFDWSAKPFDYRMDDEHDCYERETE